MTAPTRPDSSRAILMRNQHLASYIVARGLAPETIVAQALVAVGSSGAGLCECLVAWQVFSEETGRAALQAAFGGEPGAERALAATLASEQERRFIGPYELIRVLGQGGMGVVYEARHPGLGRSVALKTLLAGRNSQKALERFELEAWSMARLRHPNILRVLDAGSGQEAAYFAMELVPGGSLADLLAAGGPLTVLDAAAIGVQLAEALQHAHEHAIIHRDMKPANVLLSEDGDPLITDFGLAKSLDRDADCKLSATGQILGTLAYMSPEQVRGDAVRIDGRADIYSLGATLYELTTGHSLFVGVMEIQLIGAVLLEEPPAIRGCVDGDQQSVRDFGVILDRCLAKDLEDRYASAGELALDLGRLVAGEAIEARPFGWRQRFRFAARRHSRVVLAAGLALLIVGFLALTSLATHARLRAQGERRAQEARARAEEARRSAEASEQAAKERAGAARIARSETERLRRAEQEALGRTRRAERRLRRQFQRARELARVALFEFYDTIENLPGAAKTRELVAGRIRSYLDGLVGEARGASLRRELAVAYRRVGEVQRLSGASAERLAIAQSSLERSVTLIAALAKEQPGDLTLRKEMAATEFEFMAVLDKRGKPESAIRHGQEAMALYEGLLKKGTRLRRVAVPMATAAMTLSLLHFQTGRPEIGDALLEHAVGRLRKLDPKARDRGVPLALAKLEALQGGRLAQQGKAESARQRLLSSLAALRALSRRSPNDGHLSEVLIHTLLSLARLFHRAQRDDGALRVYGEAAAINARLRQSDPLNIQGTLQLVEIESGRALALTQLGKNKAGRRSAQAAQRACLAALGRQIGDVTLRYLLANAYQSEASSLEKDDPEASLEAALASETVLAKLVADVPRVSLYRRQLLLAELDLALRYSRRGELGSSDRHLERAHSHGAALLSRSAKNPVVRLGLARAHTQTGRNHEARSERDKARRSYGQALLILTGSKQEKSKERTELIKFLRERLSR